MKCKNCPYHQRNGDCYHLITKLEPKLLELTDRNGNEFPRSFDPHDISTYWYINPWFNDLWQRAKWKARELDGITIDVQYEICWVYHANEETEYALKPVTYFKTDDNFDCSKI